MMLRERERERAGTLLLTVFLLSSGCLCSLSLLHGITSLSVVYGCGITRQYSLEHSLVDPRWTSQSKVGIRHQPTDETFSSWSSFSGWRPLTNSDRHAVKDKIVIDICLL